MHGQFPQAEFDFAGDVGNHLDIAAEVVAVPFFFEDAGEDLAAGGEVVPAKVFAEHAFVGAQVHIAFHAVVEHEHFAVAEGIQGSRIDIEVSFQLDGGDIESFVLEEFGQAGGENPLAQPAHDGAGDDDILAPALDVAFGQRGIKFRVIGNVADTAY